MAIIKRNIWFLFYVILFVGIFMLSVLSYLKYNEIYSTYKIENENIAKLVANSSKTYFSQLEMLLKILGEQLSKEKDLYDAVVSKRIFSELIKMDDSIAGFGLIKPDGNYVMFSGNMRQIQMLPNLLIQDESRESFEKSLNSNHMVIGRTYYFEPLGAMVIPARKAIQDSTGKPIAVMSLAINLDKIDFLNTNILFSDKNVIQLYRDDDSYRQLIISKEHTVRDEKLYEKAFSIDGFDGLVEYIKEKCRISESDMKKTGFVFSYKLIPEYERLGGGNRVYLTSNTFVDTYNLWAISQIPYEKIDKNFIKIFSIYLAVFACVYTLLLVMFRYIDEFEKAKKETLEFQATHDVLTKLPNRQYLLNVAENQLGKKECIRSVVFIDLDNFKDANDIFGHDVGDLVLRRVANRLRKIAREKDIVVRHGGDEFLILSTLSNKRELGVYSQKIIDTLSQLYRIKDLNIVLGASVGIALSKDFDVSLTEVVSCADMALHEAKKEKNRYCIYEEKLKNLLLNEIEIKNQMKFALENNEFYMCYQSQMNADGSLYGVEALARWVNGKLGHVPPDKFIPLAENSGFIAPLGDYILDTVFAQMCELQEKIEQEFQVSINISLKQFMQNGFYESLLDRVKQRGINPKRITLEITESLYIHDLEHIIGLLECFKRAGIRVSMDDFGTGYSSLSILNRLPLDELKIDKQFIDNILENESSLKMIQSIVNIAKAFNFHLLAEGVETKEQVEMLKKLECRTYQGYFFSKPLKIEELEEYIKNLMA